MLARDFKRLLFVVVPVVVIFCTILRFYQHRPIVPSKVNEWLSDRLDSSQGEGNVKSNHEQEAEVPISSGHTGSSSEKTSKDGGPTTANGPPPRPPLSNTSNPLDIQASHQEIFSVSTPDRRYFVIDFAGQLNGMNPNIIPHPTLADTWIVVAQLVRSAEEQSVYFTELVCNAVFQGGVLRCLAPPTALPVAPTQGNNCNGDLAFFGLNVGPHDARVLYGPENPYIVYGSNSQYTCFGQFIQDFRQLVDWPASETGPRDFLTGTELQRPLPWGAIEKNWFPFWDPAGQMYIHYDVAPKRVFARAQADGSVSVNLAVLTEAQDDKCLARYMPKEADNGLESVHQASNSLKVTMCRRSDAGCVPSKDNTFIFTIWQHKTFYNFHGVYEPYVMLFQQEAPFAVHAVSKRPLWIHGRQQHLDLLTSDMFYVTSIAWKRADLRYHGFLDDELFIGFGIEDGASGAIDVMAEELMSGLGLCSEA